jgi:small subunit ribosomal protein S14
MKNLIERDKKRRYVFNKFEKKRLGVFAITQYKTFPQNIRWKASQIVAGLPKDSSKTRIRNRCVITGRGRAVYRQFRISRILLRNLGGKGNIPGLRKSSW